MKFNELKELNIKDWDGEPILCYVGKGLSNDITSASIDITKVVSFNAEAQHPWGDVRRRAYCHVYPARWNEEKVGECLNPKKRMTNRQLAMWLAKGKGQMLYASNTDLSIKGDVNLTTNHMYNLCKDTEECNDRIRVRKWGVEGWVEPTTDLLEGK